MAGLGGVLVSLRQDDEWADELVRQGIVVVNAKGIQNRTVVLTPARQQLLARTLRQFAGPAAIWCEDDFIARIVCDAALALGLEVPTDVAVLGLGDYRIARTGRPSLSTIPAPGQVIGSRAVERIVSTPRGEADASECVLAPAPPVHGRESTVPFAAEHSPCHRVLAMIRDHASEGLTAKDLIPLLPHSQRTFSRRFLELYGRTPGSMIRDVRFERAKECLHDSGYSVIRFAELCEFEETGKFRAFFKRETGLTQGASRKSAGKGSAMD